MAMMPKRVKFRKQQRGKIKGHATRGNYVAYGEYGIQSLEGGWHTARQYVSREGRLYVRVFADKPISKKPLETRMGKGKAEPEYWVARIKPGTILYEVTGVAKDSARDAFVRVAHKLPFRCRFVERRQV